MSDHDHDHDHDHDAPNFSRADYHRAHQARALAEAERLLAARETLGGRWLAWVAGELYALSPPPFASMVRRELQRMSEQPR
ncbi:hypothetical protein KRX52_14850 [Pseudomonas sp. MAP12]|uniref:Uncharacterized protein n=1 Tax=Geopseudomonas aromaticivorans TaxID=2849492 RepID=A0ABS6N0J2_9GAMM|nr:hypothetical protein [Pseudomonas aromaticivorans]MBV2134057.1 hypothetical protein [Pseudomonas aromaticivorans]